LIQSETVLKLRIRGNSLRVRITRSELAALNSAGEVAETTMFSAACRLTLRLCSDDTAESLRADFAADVLAVSIPGRMLRHWNQPEVISLQGLQAVSPTQELSILLEKDFPCVVPRAGEDERDAFPRPPSVEPACLK
jgi:hypothetical protein